MIKNKVNKLEVYIFLLFSFNIILAGAMFNTFVIASNNGKMPVKTNVEINTSEHFSFQDNNEVVSYQLADIIDLKIMKISIGDLLMFFGLFFIFIILLGEWIKYFRK